MNEKSLGYILLAAGIIIMIVSNYSLFLLFTNKIKPFEVFQKQTIKAEVQNSTQKIDLLKDPQAIVEMQKQIITEVLNKQIDKTMNTGATVFFIYFVMLLGFRLSTLGVQLLRPIKVNLRESNIPPKPPGTL